MLPMFLSLRHYADMLRLPHAAADYFSFIAMPLRALYAIMIYADHCTITRYHRLFDTIITTPPP